jgi:hypothetical protein
MNSGIKRHAAALATVSLLVSGLGVAMASPAAASGCTIPPCGRVTNQTSDTYILVRWKDDDDDPWSTANVAPGRSMGGWGGNPRRDVDNFWAPPGCTARYKLNGNKTSKGGWIKVGSNQTATITSVTCVDD